MTPKILTVDDSKAVRIIVKKAFKLYDCTILEAANGAEGLEAAAKEKPDLILLDVTMPTMDGVEMLSKLKQDSALKGIPVMMLTAESGKEMVIKIAKLGVRDYIVKPFQEEALIEKVIRIIPLQAKPAEAMPAKSMTDRCSIMVVDDKEAIIEQIKTIVASSPTWTVTGFADTEEAYEYAKNNPVDVALVSLSLPNEEALAFYRLLRSTVKTNCIPVLGMALKTAQAEQQQAQSLGFVGMVSKPIEATELSSKLAKALNIDMTASYFVKENGMLTVVMPVETDAHLIQEMHRVMEKEIVAAVEGGMVKAMFDLRGVSNLTMDIVNIMVMATNKCQALSINYQVMANDKVMEKSRGFEEAKNWAFVPATTSV